MNKMNDLDFKISVEISQNNDKLIPYLDKKDGTIKFKKADD